MPRPADFLGILLNSHRYSRCAVRLGVRTESWTWSRRVSYPAYRKRADCSGYEEKG